MLVTACIALSLLGSSPPQPVAVATTTDSALLRYAPPLSKVRYTENAGQWDTRTKFWGHGAGTDVWLTSTGIVYGFRGPVREVEDRHAPGGKRREPGAVDRVSVDFVGASGQGLPIGIRQVSGIERFYLGHNPGRSAHAYGAAEIKDLYPGIDLVSYVDPQANRPRYDLIVHPGADVSEIRMRYTGAKNLTVTPDGEVKYDTAFGQVSEQREMATQEGPNGAPFNFVPKQVREADGTIGFDVSGYRKDRTLVIDPLVWSSYLSDEHTSTVVNALKVSPADGSVYVAGTTLYAIPGFDGANAPGGGATAAYVSQFAPGGGSLRFVTYFGGNMGQGNTVANGLCLDSSQNIYICGNNSANDLATQNGSGTEIAYAAKLSSSGAPVWVEGLDNTSGDTASANGIAFVHTAGQGDLLFVVGYLSGPGWSQVLESAGAGGAVSAYLPASTGKSGPGGQSMLGGTNIGGSSGNDVAFAVVDNPSSPAGGEQYYTTGQTFSSDFPANYGETSFSGSSAAFLVTNGGGHIDNPSTLISGPSGDTQGLAIAFANNAVYVAGAANPSLNATSGSYSQKSGNSFGAGGYTGFIATAPYTNGNLADITAVTLFGGSNYDYVNRIVCDASGNPSVTGFTLSNDFPTTSTAVSTSPAQGFVSTLSADLSTLSYSTFLGGSGGGPVLTTGIDEDGSNNLYVAGFTTQTNFPTTKGAFQTSIPSGATSGFVTELNALPMPAVGISTARDPNPAIAGGVGVSFGGKVSVNAGFTGGTVKVTSSDPAHLLVNGAASVSIPAGSGAWFWNLTFTAPADVKSPTTVVLTASATGCPTVKETVTVMPFINPSNPPAGETAGLVFSAATVKPGGSISGTVHTFEPPATNQTIKITTSSTYVTPTSGTVVVPAGKNSSNSITFKAASVSTNEAVSVTATAPSGLSKASASFTIDVPAFVSAKFSPNPCVAGDKGAYPTATVQLSGNVSSKTQFTLTSGTPSVASNILVTVPAGSSTGTGTATTYSFASKSQASVKYTTTLTATGAVAAAGTLEVNPDVLESIVLTPTTVNAGSKSSAKVTMTSATTSAQTFKLTLNTSPATAIPVTIPAKASSVTVNVPTAYVSGSKAVAYTLSGTYGGVSAKATLTVTPNSVVGLTTIVAGKSVTTFSEKDVVQATVTLAFATPATGGTVSIPVTSSLTGTIASFKVSVPAGQKTGKTAGFTPIFQGLAAPKTVVLTAAYGTTSKETVTVNPEIVSLTLNPSTINGGASTTATITLFDDNAIAGSTATATVESPDATLAAGTNPIKITGQASNKYTFTINAKPRKKPLAAETITIQITGLGYTRTAKLTINPT